MTRQVPPDGPVPARIMIVGEAPGADEERTGVPFSGVSGMELNRMLGEAGITRNECFVTNVARIRPPGNDISAFIPATKKEITSAHIHFRGKAVLPIINEGMELLAKEIQMVQPGVIIALGNTPMWALTGVWGITKWRGSMLHTDSYTRGDGSVGWNGSGSGDINVLKRYQVIPTYHPAAVLRQWSWRATCIGDLRRAALYRHARFPRPEWNFVVGPTFGTVLETLGHILRRLGEGPQRLSFDIETRLGHISCFGLSWSLTDAICVPLMVKGSTAGYWTADQEGEIIWLLRLILTHSNAQVVGQNLLYDCQYTHRHWLFVPRVVQDTMISHHSIFSDLPKALAFQASMYCRYYKFWKEEGKNI